MSRFLRFSLPSLLLMVMLACNFPQISRNPSGSIPAIDIPTFTPTSFPTLPPTFIAISVSPSPVPPTPIPPTPIPPTIPPSPTATQECDQAQFVADVTIPDGTLMNPGERFTKTWRLKNTGTCSWNSSYAVVFFSGEQMGGPTVQALPGNVNPGQTVDISVNLTAPLSSGSYTGYWKLRNAAGVTFAQFYVQIKVIERVDVPGSGGGTFAVIHVTYDVSTFSEGSYVGCPRVTAHITTNGTGTVKYHWIRSDGAIDPVKTLSFGSAGTQNVRFEWRLGSAAGPKWVAIYIDEPNHQEFGHVTINPCTSP